MVAVLVLGVVLTVASVVFVARTLRQDKRRQAVLDERYEAWIAARGQEHSPLDGACVVVLGTVDAPRAALTDGARQ